MRICVQDRPLNLNNLVFDSDTSLCINFIAENGCDSIHCLELIYADTSFEEFTEIICFGETYIFNGIPLETDTAFCLIYPNSSGCDSIICINLTVIDHATQFNDQFCQGDTYLFNGQELVQEGIYFDTLTAIDGCDSLIILNLQLSPDPEPNFNIDGNFCIDDVVTISGDPSNSYFWQTGQTTSTISVTDPGTYITTITNTFNCQMITQVTIPNASDLEIFFSVQNPLCGDETGTIVIDSIAGGDSPYLYSINDLPFQSQNQFENLSPGNYQILVEDLNGCQSIEDISIAETQSLFVNLGEDQTLNLGQIFEVNIETNAINPTIQWSPQEGISCDTCLLTILQPTEPTTYTITLIDQNGCTATDELQINLTETIGVFVPNVFSPNEDTFNDYLTIYTDNSIESVLTFRVFNRWGGIVFEEFNFLPNEPSIGWNGKFDGQEVNSGIYLYLVEVLRFDGQKELFKGDVLLIR